ncbi:TBC1 domain family member 15 [Eumeta japonica]|uniref:TBC1 domain family member 15 n=1 Tax=Eumeta variegata TaxID=151549 RepID=A0A4C1YTD2_EUMVA|nr:TBC1 domain family member 15 [Eumeta japonica]
MKQITRNYVWWENLDDDIERTVHDSEPYRALRDTAPAPLHSWPWPTEPCTTGREPDVALSERRLCGRLDLLRSDTGEQVHNKQAAQETGSPLSTEKWDGLKDSEGRIHEAEGVKQLIFRGGVAHSIRNIVWKYLLQYYKWDMTSSEIKAYQKKKTEEYYSMKLQWRSITEDQESRFSEYRDRKSLVEKDVNRTDRTHNFYAGDNNQNLVTLSDILMTYVMYNFDLGYVQGMSDILAPILLVMGNEVDSFWCFVGFMEKIASNFNMDQADMLSQLAQVHQIISFVCPDFAQYLIQRDSSNMYFCFRWLLVWFKREFSYIDIVKLWEVLWTGLPCINFHLLVAVAILDSEKEVIMNNNYGFAEILKHVNELSMKLDVDSILSAAEGIYHQIISAPHLTNQIRIILGLPTLSTSTNTTDSLESENKEIDAAANSSQLSNGNRKAEETEQIYYRPEMEEVMYHIGLDFNF